MRRSKHKTLVAALLCAAVLIGLIIFYVQSQPTVTPKDSQGILHELESVTAYEADHGCMETNASGNRVFCGDSKKKIDALQAQYQAALKAELAPNPQAENAIRTFMDEPALQLSNNQGLRNPSNFAVTKREIIDSHGSDRIVTPPEWERKVYIFDQTSIASNCQFYSYEVDAKSSKVVQVQLIGTLAVGSEGDIAKAECDKANPQPQITASQAEDLAWAIARKNVPDLSDSKGEASFDQGDRYIWTWEDKSYKLPEGLTSEPWAYPTIRVILDKQGRLMTYLNTTFFYAETQ